MPEVSVLLPFEFLVNCGKITFILYDIQKVTTEYQVVSNFFIKYFYLNNDIMYKIDIQDINEIEEDENESQKLPLLYIMVNQPNLYFSQQHPSQKIQVC